MATATRPASVAYHPAEGVVMATGPSPRKKVKIEEVPAATDEIQQTRKLVLNEKLSQMHELKESYYDHLTECFFLQNGGGLMDYYSWRKRPTPQLVHFLKSGHLDSEDEEENPVSYLKEGKVSEEVKVSVSGSSSSASVVTEATTSNRTGAGLSLSAQHGLHRSVSDSRLLSLSSQAHKQPLSLQVVKKCGSGSPGGQKQTSYDGTVIKGISTQEAIVERAKQEAQVMSRVAELRKDGLWSSRRLPKVQEPPRPKAHWDYLLEEMQWLAADFQQERKWKKTCARKIAKMVQKYFQDLEQKELRAEKEESLKLKRVASNLAKMVKEFWANIEKVVQYKQNSRLDEKRKKAMDLHLNFIVNQTEQYSNWLSEGLAQSSKASSAGSVTPDHSIAGDDEFNPDVESESDDEETIEKDEEGIDETETQDEVAALQKESELPIEQLIETLPKEILEKPAPIHSDSEEEEESSNKNDGDEEFELDDDDEFDIEETIEEQEKHESSDYNEELSDLKNEGEMDIEELRLKYSEAFNSDFEMPGDSGEESTDVESSEEEEQEEESEEELDKSTEADDADNPVGLEALVDTDEVQEKLGLGEGPGQELTDIAAQAASLQPRGYTLQTTEVKTSIPFLLKHTLREYQHVGLDWLATMYEKRLNGILADEMGLGKTIQTIALIAHLACEKGIWGPHLIVVPTSVMLNWEMEFKKWCPAFKILTYYGSQKERKQKRQGWTKTNAFHICITSYKLVIQDHNAFRRKKWKYLILDEAQNIKNFKSQRWQCLLNFNSMRRLLLTGTPLQNSLMELWSLMHFLMPHVFQSHKDFKEWFANPLTGMIEGSHEYNENLIRRLHKVLRPFLLRRLKDDVEKQMPKKYEHIVMCHLSKRQRFLYDEFMAQGKTKETLATGHFMSVINILMQLRKVCNHPSLFDPRPIVSPFQMEGIVHHTASLVLKVFQYDPLNDLNVHFYPGLAEMERDLPAFIAHRVRKLQANRQLIEEIEIQPSDPSRPQPGKLKSSMIRCVSPALQSGNASPAVNNRSGSPALSIKPMSSSVTITGSSQPPLQAAVNTKVSAHSTSSSTDQQPGCTPVAVQVQHTEQVPKPVLPSNQLSQLPVNGSPVASVASSTLKTPVSSSLSQESMSAGIHPSTSSFSVQLPVGSSFKTQKPVMRVSPIQDSQQGCPSDNGLVFSTASASTSVITSSTSKSVSAMCSPLMVKYLEEKKRQRSKAQFFMEPLYDKLIGRQKERRDFIVRTNKQHCELKPVYGQDLCDAVNIFKDPYSSRTYKNRDTSRWDGPGHIHCQCAKFCSNRYHPKYLWNQTSVLSDILHTPEQYLQELEDVLDRFVFVTPPVQSPMLRMHVSHPPPSHLREESYRDALLRAELSPKTSNYHKICTRMTVQFPELRLIQYDCGKLQTLDILLHRLKSEDHRVLIFTQMTRMLDILEAFLNYHGHRYLRLDGTTKIEQRQQLMDRFNADKRIFVFILSTRSGGIGVNLTGADTVIFYDSDWNPTMDAQAQDRCHRIGQTRDVHIYRLVSEKTVEENILKKANQKRMLGDMAIEGGNFTTAFFKQNTINELFSEPSGLESLVREKEEEEREKQQKTEEKSETKKVEATEVQALAQFEKALAKTEDETDAIAIEQVKAEQKAELAEFDENIPLEEGVDSQMREDESHVEQELAMLHNELTPIERYAVQFTEQMMEPVNEEELKIAEEDIEAVKKDWELNRLKALKEEEERRAEMEEDEMLYTYSRDDAYQQVKKRNKQLVLDARKAATDAHVQSLSLSPRRAGRQNHGTSDDLGKLPSEKQWVYRTPKIIRDLVKNKNVLVDTGSTKRSKGRKGENDTTEDVDVETVDLIEESSKEKVKKRLTNSEKSLAKRTKKVKEDNMIKVQRSVAAHTVVSTEATKLDSLPGYSVPSVREGIFQKLQQSPPKLVPDRANIFEQFGLQTPPVHGVNVVQTSGPAPVFQSHMAGQTVRLISTPQGRQMVVVSSSPTALQQTSPQNVVLLQGMQGFTQGIVVGNSIVSLQGTPLQVAPLGRGGNPVSLQSPRIVGTPHIIQPTRVATRVVSPGQGSAFVQRLVGASQVNTSIIPASVSFSQLSPQASNLQQLGAVPQFKIQSPLVHNTGGQIVNIQTPAATSQRKSSVQTIANLIAAGKMAKQNPPPSKLNQPSEQHASLKTGIPNLGNLMKAQVPQNSVVGSSAQQTQVRVNPTVAKLVASHIHSANATCSPSSTVLSTAVTSARAPSPAIINLASVSRSQSPTVVKVVSVSRTNSPSPKVGVQQQFGKAPSTQIAAVKGENPVATINIKGLPPGVSIPASLVNSLVSGSIGGISKGGLIKGILPNSTNQTTTTKAVMRKIGNEITVNSSNDNNDYARLSKQNTSGATNGGLSTSLQTVLPHKIDSPDYRVMAGMKPNPDSAAISPSAQAWSNPNLVIRTRRAAVQQQQQPLTRSPQIAPSPTAPNPTDIPTTIVVTNGPQAVNLPSHIQGGPTFVAKKLDHTSVQDTSEQNYEKGVDIIEIS